MSASASDAPFEALLDFLRQSRGSDFTGYKRSSLERRVRRRMEAVGIEGYGDYLDHLEVHPDEFPQLFDTLLINVTEFFRDPPVWQQLREQALPLLLREKTGDERLRVWSAGCATGQEAYTLAMVLAEALGVEDYAERVKIYATDIDEDALAVARHATYDARAMETVPEELRERYFERADQRWSFRRDLRRTVIFGRNNLVSDAPISRLDLLVCRNTLMYFNAETQNRILRHFHFALRDPGILVLGRSEMIISAKERFEALDMRLRVFRRLSPQAPAVRAVAVPQQPPDLLGGDEQLAREAALETSPHAQLVVSHDGRLTLANLAARQLLRIPLDDLGRPFTELSVSYQPVELRDAVAQALRDRRRVQLGEVQHSPERGQEKWLDVTVTPLVSDADAPIGVAIAFEDVTRHAQLQRELEGNRRDLELAYEELQSTIDELETTNEELQSANEELQTTNEELQSTNEELETMNEELHSTNEELETINDELRERTTQLKEVNEFLEAILASLGVAVTVVDTGQQIQVWNGRAEDLWGVRPDEALEHHFLGLDIGLPVERLAAPLRAVLAGHEERRELELEAVNRRGRAIACLVTVLPLQRSGDGSRIQGAIVLMEDRSRQGADG